MLLELNIKNFAIIEDLSVSFKKGLNIITGETGTGKSILIEALGVILGSRTNRDFIRTGEEESNLEAVFYVENNNIDQTLEDYGIGIDEDRLLIINKTISRTGPSLSKINGKNVNLSMLARLTRKLVDIFGQHEHQSLLDVSNHKLLLDSFGKEDFRGRMEDYRELYGLLMERRKYLEEISIDRGQRDREIDILNYEIAEIEGAELRPEKDRQLEDEYRKYSKINEINLILANILKNFSSDGFEDRNIIDIISKAVLDLGSVRDIDEDLGLLHERFKNILYELEDLKAEAINYGTGLDFNPNYLRDLEERLDLINKLKSKYGQSLEEVLDFKDRAQERLFVLSNQEREITALKSEIGEIEGELSLRAGEISQVRRELAQELEVSIQSELEYLNMKEISFKVDLRELDDFTRDGRDRVEFLISTNIGEGLKPLSKIASGGEMSRIMLAFKTILAECDSIETMIFDEIDTGISGRTAQLVGEKIYKISRQHQVICISHLAQITAMADEHYSINKETIGHKTGSYIKQLSYEERVEELARLIGGVDLTETTLKHAVEMIQMCQDLKERI